LPGLNDQQNIIHVTDQTLVKQGKQLSKWPDFYTTLPG